MNNITVKRMKKPEISDIEIQHYMDFANLMNSHGIEKSASRKAVVIKTVMVSIALLTIIGLYLLNNKATTTPVAKKQVVSKVNKLNKISKPAETKSKIESVSQPKTVSTSIVKQKQIPESTKPSVDEIKTKKEFIEAEPADGYTKLYEYFDRELKHPDVKNKADGIVTVSFSINTKGKPEQIVIQNSLGVEYDRACIDLIQRMPSWKPALLDGKPIATKLSVPLTFKSIK